MYRKIYIKYILIQSASLLDRDEVKMDLYDIYVGSCISSDSLHWRHNDHDSVSNHQPRGCLLNCLFRRRSKKTSELRVTGLCVVNSPGPVNSPQKGPVTREMFPFDYVIMSYHYLNDSVILVLPGTHRNVGCDLLKFMCHIKMSKRKTNRRISAKQKSWL